MKVISVCNQKGGVGKTTTVFNLGVALAKKDKKVLLIDLDAQANLSSYCHFEGDGQKFTISDLISAELDKNNEVTENDMLDVIQHNDYGIDYIPSDINLSTAEIALLNTMYGREKVLANLVKKVKGYDYVLVDCLPSLGMLFINALFASDGVIIPVQTQKFALDGIKALTKTLNDVNKDKSVKLLGVIPTMTDNTKVSNEIVAELHKEFSDDKITPEIRKRAEAGKSAKSGKPVSASGDLGVAYSEIADIIIKAKF